MLWNIGKAWKSENGDSIILLWEYSAQMYAKKFIFSKHIVIVEQFASHRANVTSHGSQYSTDPSI